MTRASLMVILLLPTVALAQDTVLRPPVLPVSPVSPGDRQPGAHFTLPRIDGAALSRDERREFALGQAAPAERRRRRPSMVGYINDAGIQSQVRVRFETGRGVSSADRAEFFYAKSGFYRELPAGHVLHDPDARGLGPSIITNLDFEQLYAQAEYAFGGRFSAYAELPVRWLRPQAFAPGAAPVDNQTGLSDVRAGVKFGLVAAADQMLTVQLQGSFPTGNGRKGLGVEHFSFEPALLYNASLSDRINLEGQVGLVVPTDGSSGIFNATDEFAGRVLYYGIGPSIEVYRQDGFSFAPVVEVVGWHVWSGFQSAGFSEADGVNIVNLKLGGRFGFNESSDVYIGYGKSLTDAVWYRHLLRLEYRYTF